MARIVIDARLINSSTGRYTERLIHYLEMIDVTNEYLIVVPTKDEFFYRPSKQNFSVVTADFEQYSIAEQIGFKRLLESLTPDLVHFCMPQQPVLYKGKKITTFHDLTLLNTYNSDKNWLMYKTKQFVGRFVFKNIAHSSAHILTPTIYTKDALVRFSSISPSKVTVTYEAAEHTPTELEPYDVPFKKFIMYVGQQPDYKNIRRLGDAHQALLRNHPDLGLVLVGKKAADTLANEAYFSEKGYRNIHFTGFIPDAQRDWLMKECEAYVFPSLMEGFGLPGLEAMAAGAPVVSSNATCLPEVYGDAAHYFDPMNTDDMARAIEAVITNDSLKQELIRKGSDKVKEYSWKRMAEQTHAAYIKALGI